MLQEMKVLMGLKGTNTAHLMSHHSRPLNVQTKGLHLVFGAELNAKVRRVAVPLLATR